MTTEVDGTELGAALPQAQHERQAIVPMVIAGCLAVTVLVFVQRAIGRGQDWSFDSHSYHNVYAYATLFERDRIGTRPMSLGAYFNPLLDLPLGWGVRHVGPRKVTAALATVQSFAVIAAATLPWHVLTGSVVPAVRADVKSARQTILAWVAVYACAAVLAYGAIGRIQLGGTFGDMTSVVPAIVAVHLVLRWIRRPRLRTVFWAGALFGLACSLKYTNGPALLGGLVAVTAAAVASRPEGATARAALAAPARFLVGAIGGFVATAGPWSLSLWIRFGNPLFPFGGERLNAPMRTVDGGYVDLGAHAFVFRSWSEYVTLPVRLLRPTNKITEVPIGDPRVLLGAVAVAACVGIALVRRRRAGAMPDHASTHVVAQAMAALWLTSYVAWGYLFGNGRYLVFVELLTPVVLIAALASGVAAMAGRPVSKSHVMAGSAAMLSLLAAVVTPFTTSTGFAHVPFGDRWYDLDISALPPLDDAMVIAPYEFEPLDFGSFVLQPKVFVRLHGVLLPTRLGQEDVERIARFDGPMYSFQLTDSGDANLAAVGLRNTGECYPAQLVQGGVIDLCRLEPT